MTQEDYVSFETAKLLKEKGFDECCHIQYKYVKEFDSYLQTSEYVDNDFKKYYYPCPTLQMAMKWLREKKHNLNICFRPVKLPSEIEWRAYIFNKDCEPLPINAICGKTYEETCEEAIKYCLKNLI